MVFIRCVFDNDFKIINCDEEFIDVDLILNELHEKTGIPVNIVSLYSDGKRIHGHHKISTNATVDICLSVFGGKGGFGSMLRAIGAQIEKTTNREACRDLSGRRLRDINEEQRLKRWLAKKAEREAEQLKHRKEKLLKLKELPKHEFHDPEYNKERSELPERIDNALSQGLKKAPLLGKKLLESTEDEPPTKKERIWFDDSEILSDLSDSDLDIDQPSLGESSKKKIIEPSTSSLDSTFISESSVSQDFDSQCSSQMSNENSVSSETDIEAVTKIDKSDISLTNSKSVNSPKSKDTNSNELAEGDVKENVNEESINSPTDKLTSLTNSKSENSPEQIKNSCSNKSAEEDKNINQNDSKESLNPHSDESTENGENKNTKREIEESLSIINSSSLLPQKTDSPSKKMDEEDIDLLHFNSVIELEQLGLEKLKIILMKMGLKCGGTLSERASRLWSVRGLDPKDYPKSLRTKTKN